MRPGVGGSHDSDDTVDVPLESWMTDILGEKLVMFMESYSIDIGRVELFEFVEYPGPNRDQTIWLV